MTQRVLSFDLFGSAVDQLVVHDLSHPCPDAVYSAHPDHRVGGLQGFGEAFGAG